MGSAEQMYSCSKLQPFLSSIEIISMIRKDLIWLNSGPVDLMNHLIQFCHIGRDINRKD